MPELTYAEAIWDAHDSLLANDPNVFVIGLGAPDNKGVFGTTLGLAEKYPGRVFDMPLAENAVTGVCVGAALRGMKPILVHQRMDFSLLSMDQIVNQAAKWKAMFGDDVPLVIRMIVGRGWGQGPQHSQSLQAMFAHVPGLKVVMPVTPWDAKGMLLSAVDDPGPVVFIEHRWLHGIRGIVNEFSYRVPLDTARIERLGEDVTIVACSHMVLEAMRAADMLEGRNIYAEVVDLRSIRPIDHETVIRSVKKTGNLIVADTGHIPFGVGSEILASVSEKTHGALKSAPVRIGLPDYPSPTSHVLSAHYYPRAGHIVQAVLRQRGEFADPALTAVAPWEKLDQPDPSFRGPF